MQKITATYRVTCAADEIQKQAQGIALEQTVEVPQQLVTDPAIQRDVVGQIESITPIDDADEPCHAVRIAYNAALANEQLPQLLNLVYGNISIKNNILLSDIQFDDDWLKLFKGPNFGTEGVRSILGVYDRPLLSTAIKPRGSALSVFERIVNRFAIGGGDIIKDDHNLVDENLEAFKTRVRACQEAVDRANSETGRNCLYFPNICVQSHKMESYAAAALRLGVRGILISPLLVGLDMVRHIAEAYPLIIMTHPTFAGTFFHDRRHGIEPGVLLGTLFRLAGADISVYPNFGGRFGFTAKQCKDIAHRMACPFGHLRGGLGAPAGGMQFDSIGSMVEHYGSESVFLVGGALLSHSEDVAEGTRAFREAIELHFQTRLVEPDRALASACELPGHNIDQVVVEHLPINSTLGTDAPVRWQGRDPVQYKELGGDLPFKDVIRHELLGKQGEPMAFDLRYFELGPGGYTSCEKHVHIHAIIGARGSGRLQVKDRQYEIKPMDVAYVPPLAVHQMVNDSETERLGFFCVVDRDRDRPIKP